MGNVIRKEQCPSCLDSGRDNLAVYEDEGTYCFGCGYSTRGEDEEMVEEVKNIAPSLYQGGAYLDIITRGLGKATCEKLGIRAAKYTGTLAGAKYENHKVLVLESFDDSGQVVSQKIRDIKDRGIVTQKGNAKAPSLFGQHAFSPTELFPITITEGELDAASIYEATGYACVSVRKGAQGAKKELMANLEWLSQWKHVILAFDNDEAGRKATEQCLDLFEPGKVRVATMPLKDANDMLMGGRGKELKKILWDAKQVGGDNVITFDQITIEDIAELATTGAELPWPKLNDMLGGLKSKHLYTLAAREKSGKTSVTKEIAMHLSNQGKKVGLVYLEGDALREAISFVAMKNNEPMWQVEESLNDPGKVDSIHKQLQEFKDSGLHIYNHKGAIDVASVYNKIHYMVKGLDCEYIILDNLSISIAGNGADTNERREIDQMVFRLISLINNSGCTILNVVHLVKNRKDKDGNDSETVSRSDVHGSGAFAKFSHGLIGLERDPDSNSVKLKVLANRDKGTEGYADTLTYNPETGRLNIRVQENAEII